MYVYMSECVYVFMYLYACKSDEREREREREREGDKSPEGNFIALKNVVTCVPDPIMLYLANRFWPSALINSVL